MGKGSKGLKAGLAGGAIYGFLVGILHFGQYQVCSSYLIPRIYAADLQQNSSATLLDAQAGFVQASIYVPMVFAILALIIGIIYGGIFAYVYYKIPFATSKAKGIAFGVAIFLIGIPLGLSAYEINCMPYYNLIPLAISLPVSLATGYLIGMFYDAFGRSSMPEQTEAPNVR